MFYAPPAPGDHAPVFDQYLAAMCAHACECLRVFDMGGSSTEYFVHRINIDTNQSKGPIDLWV